MAGTKIVFRCSCGASIRVRSVYAGRRCRCPRCTEEIVIPADGEAVPPPAPNPFQPAPSRNGSRFPPAPPQAICSICQCRIDETETSTNCPQCGLPFHPECWQENFGCSAYGCSQVNALKPGPDICIEAIPDSYPEAILVSADSAEDFPWDYLLLGTSGLALLLGACTFGLPCLAAGAGAAYRLTRLHANAGIGMVVLSAIISFGGFIAGVLFSIYLWRLL
jgi:hypothetical protein